MKHIYNTGINIHSRNLRAGPNTFKLLRAAQLILLGNNSSIHIKLNAYIKIENPHNESIKQIQYCGSLPLEKPCQLSDTKYPRKVQALGPCIPFCAAAPRKKTASHSS